MARRGFFFPVRQLKALYDRRKRRVHLGHSFEGDVRNLEALPDGDVERAVPDRIPSFQYGGYFVDAPRERDILGTDVVAPDAHVVAEAFFKSYILWKVLKLIRSPFFFRKKGPSAPNPQAEEKKKPSGLFVGQC